MTFSLKHISGISLLAFMCALGTQPVLASSLVTLNTSSTIASGSNVAITSGTNPVLDNTSGTATSPVVTYAGSGTAAISIGGTLVANSGDTALAISGNNAHGAGDVTSGITFTGNATTSGAASAVTFASTGQYNFFTLASGASLTSGTSGATNAALVVSSTGSSSGLTVTNSGGTITGQIGLSGVQSGAANTQGIYVNNTSGTITTSGGSGPAINFTAGAANYDGSVNISGGNVTTTGTGPAIGFSNIANTGNSVTVSGGTVSSLVNGAQAAIDVSAATNAASTITLSSGVISNGAGAAGLAIKLGQLNDTVDVTGGTLTGTIQTATNGDGIVNFNANNFSTNGAMGASGKALQAVNVNGGTLTLNNAINAGSFNLSGGTTTLGQSAIAVTAPSISFGGGTLALATDTLNIGTSTLTATSNSTIDTIFSSNINGKIVSSGAITNSLSTGGHSVQIDPTFSGFTPTNGNEFVVLTGTTSTSGLTAASLGNGILDPHWSFIAATSGTDTYGNAITGNNVALYYNGVVNAHTLQDISVNSGNAVNAGDSLGAPSKLSQALLGLTTSGQVSQAGTQLALEANRGSIEGATTAISGTMDTISTRLDSMRDLQSTKSGLNSGEGGNLLSVWMQGFGGASTQGERQGIDGYSASGGGVAVGADKLWTESLRVGAAFSYAHTDVSDNGVTSGNSMNINSYMGTLYGSYQGSPWYVDGALDYGYHQYQSTRLISFPGFTDVTNGSHNGYQYTARFLAGYPLPLEPALLTPIAGVNYTHLDQDGYAESSSNGAALAVGSQSNNSVKSTLGTKISTNVAVDSYNFVPEATLVWDHEFVSKALQTTNSYVAGGSSFVTTDVKPILDTAHIGFGLTTKATDDLTISVRYGLDLGASYVSNMGLVQARLDF